MSKITLKFEGLPVSPNYGDMSEKSVSIEFDAPQSLQDTLEEIRKFLAVIGYEFSQSEKLDVVDIKNDFVLSEDQQKFLDDVFI